MSVCAYVVSRQRPCDGLIPVQEVLPTVYRTEEMGGKQSQDPTKGPQSKVKEL
jgi:hypothetical protein